MSEAVRTEVLDRPPHYPPSGGVLRPFVKGLSGNPGGRTAEYKACIQAARTASPEAMRKLVLLADSEDERVALIAVQAILDRAWGKPKDYDPREADTGDRLDFRKLPPEYLRIILEICKLGIVAPAQADDAQQPTDNTVAPETIEATTSE